MSKYVLVKLNDNWEHEFEIEALWATTQDEYNTFKKQLSRVEMKDKEIYFGTNEFVSFSSTEDFFNSLEIFAITKEFYNTFINIIGETFGLISIPDLLEHFDLGDFE